jgi:hypothetical protein
MADDTDNDNGGIGLGSAAAGALAAAGTVAATAYTVAGDKAKEKTVADLSAAETALTELNTKHAGVKEAAMNKVRATQEGRTLIQAEETAQRKLQQATSTHSTAERGAMQDWLTKGSPEAIASGKAEAVIASKTAAQEWEAASEGLKRENAALESFTQQIRTHHAREAATKIQQAYEAAINERMGSFLNVNKKLLSETEDLTKPQLEQVMQWIAARDRLPTYEEKVAHNADLPEVLRSLAPEKQRSAVAAVKQFHEELGGVKKMSPSEFTSEVETVIAEETKGIKARIAEHEGVLERLKPQKAIAVDKVVAQAKTEMDAADAALKQASGAVTAAMEKHAGSEMSAIRTAEATVEKLKTRAGILTGEGNFLTKAWRSRPLMMIALPVTALGAVIGGSYLLFGKKSSSDTRWRDQVNQEKTLAAASRGGAEPSPA